MTAPAISSHGKVVILFFLAVLVYVLVVAAARKTDVAFASDFSNTVRPTHAPFYAVVDLTKATYTPTPTLEPPTQVASITVELPTAAESSVSAEIVPDASIPGDGAPSLADPSNDHPGYTGNKYILVDISEQHMYVYEGDTVAYSFVASTGMNNATRVGSFSVLDKIPNAYGATWDLWMPNWLGIYWSGSLENGIHALPILSNGTQLWAGYLGTPISFGCVVLGVSEAQTLYDWVEVGTPVDIQW